MFLQLFLFLMIFLDFSFGPKKLYFTPKRKSYRKDTQQLKIALQETASIVDGGNESEMYNSLINTLKQIVHHLSGLDINDSNATREFKLHTE